MFAVLELARADESGRNSAWYVVTALFIGPFVLFAPFNGVISNGFSKRWVLVGSAVLALLAAFILSLGAGLLPCLVLAAVGAAVYNPARYAVLPAAAEDTGLPLTRLNGWVELGGATAIIGGVVLALYLQGVSWLGSPATLVVVMMTGVVCVLAALPTQFAADVRRREPPWPAVAGFFRDAGRVLRDPAARGSLLGLAALLALVTAGSGAVVMYVLGPGESGAHGPPLQAMLLVSGGAAAGSWLAGRESQPRRCLGLVPVGVAGLLLTLAWIAGTAEGRALPIVPCLLLGVMGGLANVPLRAAYQAAVPADARGNAMAVGNFFIYTLTTALSVLLAAGAVLPLLNTPLKQLWFLAGLAAFGAVIAGWVLRGAMGELLGGLIGRDTEPVPHTAEPVASSGTKEGT